MRGKRRHHRERGRERGEEERGEPQADGLAEESSRGETEPKPTAVRTYYRKRNNGELGAFRLLPPPRPTTARITITSNVNDAAD